MNAPLKCINKVKKILPYICTSGNNLQPVIYYMLRFRILVCVVHNFFHSVVMKEIMVLLQNGRIEILKNDIKSL